MATLLSAIPLAARGPAQIFVFDIHALQERFYFSDTVIPRYCMYVALSLEIRLESYSLYCQLKCPQ